MAKFSIRSASDGAIKYSGEPTYNGSFGKVSYLEFREIASPTPIEWARGDYVDYTRTGIRYTLRDIPQVKKQSKRTTYGAAFVYKNVQFKADTEDLVQARFRDIVEHDNLIPFSTLAEVNTTEDVYGIAARIQANMDLQFPGSNWNIIVVDIDEDEDPQLYEILHTAKNFSLSNGSCMDALDQIYSMWNGIGWIYTQNNGNTITIGRPNLSSPDMSNKFEYGKGKGLKVVQRNVSGKDEMATRIYAYGSTRNMPSRYYNSLGIHNGESDYIPHLMLPLSDWGTTGGLPDARKAFLENTSATAKWGLRPRVVYFDGTDRELDEVYPSIEGMTIADVRNAVSSATDGEGLYYPSDTVYSRIGWERVDHIWNGDDTDDDGRTSDGAKALSRVFNDVYSTIETEAEITEIDSYTFVRREYTEEEDELNEGNLNINTIIRPLTIEMLDDYVFKENNIPELFITYINYQGYRYQTRYYGTRIDEKHISFPGIQNLNNSFKCKDFAAVEVSFKMPFAEAEPEGGEEVNGGAAAENGSNDGETTNGDTVGTEGNEGGAEPGAGEVAGNEEGDVSILNVRVTAILHESEIDTRTVIIDATNNWSIPDSFTVQIPQIGFDINRFKSADFAQGKCMLSMKSGMCAGREFVVTKVQYNEDGDCWILTCQRTSDESVGMLYPNIDYPINGGDAYVLLEMRMPECYIGFAESRLHDLAMEWLAAHSRENFVYEPEIDAKKMVEAQWSLIEGMYLRVHDEDIIGDSTTIEGETFANTDVVMIDSLTIDEASPIPLYKVVLRDERRQSFLNRLKRESSRPIIVESASKIQDSLTPNQVAEVNDLLTKTKGGAGGQGGGSTAEGVILNSIPHLFEGGWANLGSVPTEDWIRANFMDINATIEEAGRLSTPRELWGNSFDGSEDVDGPITFNPLDYIDRDDTAHLQVVTINNKQYLYTPLPFFSASSITAGGINEGESSIHGALYQLNDVIKADGFNVVGTANGGVPSYGMALVYSNVGGSGKWVAARVADGTVKRVDFLGVQHTPDSDGIIDLGTLNISDITGLVDALGGKISAPSANIGSATLPIYWNSASGTFATITSYEGNAATATSLKTSRKLWGNAFNGTADVNGALTFGTDEVNPLPHLSVIKHGNQWYLKSRLPFYSDSSITAGGINEGEGAHGALYQLNDVHRIPGHSKVANINGAEDATTNDLLIYSGGKWGAIHMSDVVPAYNALTIKKNGTTIGTYTPAAAAAINITIGTSDISGLDTLLGNYILASSKGQANGIATLDANGRVPSGQLPSYVDDVLEYANKASFPSTGESGKIYVDLQTNLTYRWSGTAYVEISPSLALGETSSTAYRGDRGKVAYDHSQITSGNPHGVTFANIGGALDASQIPDISWSKIISTPSTLAGYGITDAYTKTEADGRYHPYGGSASIAFNAASVTAGNITPRTNYTYNLGSTLSYWQSGYVRKIFLNRAQRVGGISFYSPTFNAWQIYMSDAITEQGVNTNLTAPVGTYVTSWALRSFIENTANYGWTWEVGSAYSTTPTVVAELRSSDGLFYAHGDLVTGGKLKFNNYVAAANASTSGYILEIVEHAGQKYLHSTLPFYSDSSITAGGINQGGGSAITAIAYNTAKSLTSENLTQVASAYSVAALRGWVNENFAPLGSIPSGVLTTSNYAATLGSVYAAKSHTHTISQITDIANADVRSAHGLWRIATVPSVGGTDLNTILEAGGIVSNYTSVTYWGNAPYGMLYGSAIQLTGEHGLPAQFAWDINSGSTSSTRNLWWRAKNNLGWQNDWQQIITSSNIGSQSVAYATSAGSVARATFGDAVNAEHNCNNIVSNGLWYYNSNGPSTSIGATTSDGALYSQAYSLNWVGQIAQDYRNGSLFVRGKNNGSWTSWLTIYHSGNLVNPLTQSNYSTFLGSVYHPYQGNTTTPMICSLLTVGSSAFFSNNNPLYIKDNGGTYRYAIWYNINNQLFFGRGQAEAGHTVYYDGSPIIFRTGTTPAERMRITSDGNVGFGTPGPLAKVDVRGDFSGSHDHAQLMVVGATTTTYRLAIGYDTTNNYGFIQPLQYGVAYKNLVLCPEDGRVGIGVTNPGYKLQVGGTLHASGNITTGGFFFDSSDIRRKTNIASLDYSLEDILSIPTISYNWKDKPNDKKAIGTTAQGVMGKFPQLVATDNEGFMYVNYDSLGVLALYGLKKEDDKVRRLERRVAELELRIRQLEAA